MKVIYVVFGGIVIAALAAAGGFFGGMTYAQSQAQNSFTNFARQRAVPNPQANAQGTQPGSSDPCGFGRAFQFSQGTQGGQGNQGATGGQAGQGGQFRGQGSGAFAGGFGGLSGAQLGNCVARGEIKSIDGDMVQISTADKVVTVKVSDQTMISKTDRGTLADLKPGDRVTVFSNESGDTPTATGIQLQRLIRTQGQQ